MKKRCPSRRWDRRGVSEIIANLLILGITVTLFSSVLMFVTQMPAPKQEVYTDFSATTEIQPATGNCWINVTNQGGQVLSDFRTKIYILKDDQAPLALNFSDSLVNIGSTWDTGEMWAYQLTGVIDSTRLSIMVIDYVSNSMVWSSVLRGEGGGFSPVIGERGTTPTPSYAGESIRFYASVMDPDGNLRTNSVFVNATSIDIAFPIQLTDPNNDGVFVSTYPYTAAIGWYGKIVIVNATDKSDRESTARMTLDIQLKPGGGTSEYGPFYNYTSYFVNGTYPPDATGGESSSSGGGVGTTFYYIRRMSDMAITNTFSPGESVFIEVYSTGLKNLALENAFYLYQPITGQPISPQSQPLDAFKYGGIFGTFYRYIYNFSAPSDPYIYPLQMKFKDTTGVVVNVVDTISSAGGTYPKLETYKYVNPTTMVKTTNFNHTDTVYLRIVTKDPDLSASTVYVSDLEISDYSGRYIVKKVPPTYAPIPAYSAPVSSVFKTSGTNPTPANEGFKSGVYTSYIVLKDAYQGWWLPKKNAYSVRISMVTDTGSGGGTAEIYNSLSLQINVTAPLSTTDIVATVGSGSFTWSASGAYWANNKIAWFSGGEQWDETVIDDNPNKGCIGVAMNDVSGDGRNDVVVGTQDPSYANLVWYENLNSDGKTWSSGRPITMPFDAISGKQADMTSHSFGTWYGNSDKGTANEDVTIWSSNRASFVTSYGGNEYTCTNELTAQIAVADLDHDGDGDVIASFIHVVVYTSATSPGDADSTNSWGMYFNRGVYVFWNDGNWRRTILYSTNWYVTSNAANKDTNGAAMDLATGDFDRDGYPDVVAVYENGSTQVWMNQWGKVSGDVIAHENGAFSTAVSLRKLPRAGVDAQNSNPWDHVQYVPRVRIADMNLDNYPDIVRTTTRGKNVYIYQTQPGTPDELLSPPQFEYNVDTDNTAARTGSMSSLTTADAVYEALREVYRNYSTTAATPLSAKVDPTNSTSDPANLNANDSAYFDVNNQEVMWLYDWNVDNSYNGKIVSYAKLKARYYVDSGFITKTFIKWSLNGVTWYDTTIKPLSTETGWVYKEFVFPVSVDSFSKIQNMNIIYNNRGSGGSSTVHFDLLNIDVKFVETRQMGWIWQIPNANKAFHNLTFVGHRDGLTSEKFRLAYSIDNTTWFNLTDISSITDTTFTYQLPYTPSQYYWVRVEDLDRTTGDTFNNTLYADSLIIRHYALSVTWDVAHTYNIAWVAPDTICAIAIGDMGKMGGDYKPDGWLDIVVSTARVGTGNDLRSLFILTATGLNPPTFDPRPIYATQLSIMCSNSALYDTKSVELGDTNGDGSLDIVLVVGAPPGVNPGTGPTMWSYVNQNLFSGGAWQFAESYVNILASKGESAINIKTGNIDLAIFLPFLGVLGVVAAEALVDRKKRH